MQKYRTSQGDTADQIAWRQYGTQTGRVVEQLLNANPGLADYGPILPAGLVISLPDIKPATETAGIRLWE